MAASFTDQTTRIWDLNKILGQGSEGLERPDCILKDSVELAPVEVGMAGHKLAASSIDGTLKLYDINASDDGTVTAKQLLDPSAADYNGGEMNEDQMADYNIGADASDLYQQSGTYAFCINPLNTDQILTGQLSLQILELQAAKKGLKLLHDFHGDSSNQKFINCMDWSSNGQYVACGDIDGQSLIYQLEQDGGQVKSAQKASLITHGKGVKAIKFSPDSTTLVTGGEDLHMNMVDVETQQRVLTLVNHADWITSIAFNPADPGYFASTSLDGTVKIWKQGSNKEVKTVEFNGNGGVWKAEFTPDGRFIGVCCQDGTIGLVSFVN